MSTIPAETPGSTIKNGLSHSAAQKVTGAEPKGENRLMGAPAGGGGGMCHGRGAVVVGVEEKEMVEVGTVVPPKPPYRRERPGIEDEAPFTMRAFPLFGKQGAIAAGLNFAGHVVCLRLCFK